MLTWPNILSLLRMPLALFFFQENPFYRVLAIVLAMVTDILDGYLARKYRQTSTVGAWLDPITDKLFVLTALLILYHEERLLLWQAAAMLGRDFAVMSFGAYLTVRGYLTEYRVKAIMWGKITTALQFVVLITLVLYGALPFYFYLPFIAFSLLALRELFCSWKTSGVRSLKQKV
ncbi:MAG: CDP-alcohol phosphatidyltransferase family protein [Parachlamydiaceae bacterium]|nr:CDP-alcohol phosphatidyltransferase family protein [Parachlamydiaceae bacterium]